MKNTCFDLQGKNTFFFPLFCAADLPWLRKKNLNKTLLSKSFLQKSLRSTITSPQQSLFGKTYEPPLSYPEFPISQVLLCFFFLLIFLWQILHSRQIPDLQYRMLLKETLLSDARIKSNKPHPASCWQLHFFPNAYFSLAWPSTIWQVCPVGKFIINSLQLEVQ